MLEEDSGSIITFEIYDDSYRQDLFEADDFRENFFLTVPADISSLKIVFETESNYATIYTRLFSNLCHCISSLQNLRILSLSELRLNDGLLDVFSTVTLDSKLQLQSLLMGKEKDIYDCYYEGFSLSNSFTMEAVPKLLNSLAVHSPNLKSLNLSSKHFAYDPEYADGFLQGLLRLKDLSSLNMSGCFLNKAGPFLYNMFSSLTSLRTIDLSYCSLGLEGVKSVCDGLSPPMWKTNLREVVGLLELRVAKDRNSGRVVSITDRNLIQIFIDILSPRPDGSFSIGSLVSSFLPKKVHVTSLKMDFLYISRARDVLPHIAKLRGLEYLSIISHDRTPDACKCGTDYLSNAPLHIHTYIHTYILMKREYYLHYHLTRNTYLLSTVIASKLFNPSNPNRTSTLMDPHPLNMHTYIHTYSYNYERIVLSMQ